MARSGIREKPVRLEYALTEKSRPLERAIVAIAGWAKRRVALPRTAWETETTRS